MRIPNSPRATSRSPHIKHKHTQVQGQYRLTHKYMKYLHPVKEHSACVPYLSGKVESLIVWNLDILNGNIVENKRGNLNIMLEQVCMFLKY